MSLPKNGRVSSEPKQQCQYKEYNMLLVEHFMSGLHDHGMIDEILKEVPTLKILQANM